MRTPHAILEVTAQDAESLQINLTAAVEQARDVAMSVGCHGIMVTQHGFNFFTVKLSPDVPYGETFEQRNFDQP